MSSTRPKMKKMKLSSIIYPCSNSAKCTCGCHNTSLRSSILMSQTNKLMNGSGIAGQQSILLDNGEYFFDDDFAIPFDCNLREENNNMDNSGSETSQRSNQQEINYVRRQLRGSMVSSQSDTCLYQLESIIDIPFEEETEHQTNRMANQSHFKRMATNDSQDNVGFLIGDVTESDLQSDPLFSPPSNSQILFNTSNGGQSMKMSYSSCYDQGHSDLKELLQRQRSPQDYTLTYMNASQTKTNFPFSAAFENVNKDPNVTQDSNNSNMSTWASLAMEGSRKFRSQQDIMNNSTSGNADHWTKPVPSARKPQVVIRSNSGGRPRMVPPQSNMTTWRDIRTSSSKSSGVSILSINENEPLVITPGLLLQRPSRTVSLENARLSQWTGKPSHKALNTWREFKKVAAGNLTSWKDLKMAAASRKEDDSSTARGRQPVFVSKNNSLLSEPQVVVPRSSSEPPKAERRNYRFSGTLLELYQRAVQTDSSSSGESETVTKTAGRRHKTANAGVNTSKDRSELENHLPTANQLLGYSPSEETQDGRKTFALLSTSQTDRELKNFGAQFPPQETGVQRRSRPETRTSVRAVKNGGAIATMPRARSSSAIRKQVEYPGLGTLAIPKQSRLSASAFLSRTLPDLSFLAGDSMTSSQNTNKSPPTCKSNCQVKSKQRPNYIPLCRKCGCASSPTNPGAAQDAEGNVVSSTGSPLTKFISVPDLVSRQLEQLHQMQEAEQENEPKPALLGDTELATKLDRTFSEPRLSGLMEASNGSSDRPGYYSSSQEELDDGNPECRAKKSVSFSENIQFHRLLAGESGNLGPVPFNAIRFANSYSMVSDLKVIPRDCGLYGQDAPLAQFQLASPNSAQLNEQSTLQKRLQNVDLDKRYQALVLELYKSIEQAVLYFTLRHKKELANVAGTNSSSSISSAASNNEKFDALSIVVPLTTLVSDGLLPPSKGIFAGKYRTRLWLMVEESCKPGTSNRVLSEILREVKSLTNITTEKAKFKCFVYACLNAKALHMWVSSLINNKSLLKRFYSPDAFLSRCLTTHCQLAEELLVSLENLLNIPFRLELNENLSRTKRTGSPSSLQAAAKSSAVKRTPSRGKTDTGLRTSPSSVNRSRIQTNTTTKKAESANQTSTTQRKQSPSPGSTGRISNALLTPSQQRRTQTHRNNNQATPPALRSITSPFAGRRGSLNTIKRTTSPGEQSTTSENNNARMATRIPSPIRPVVGGVSTANKRNVTPVRSSRDF